MKKFLTAVVAAIFLLMSHVNAEVKTYTGTGEYRMGDSDTPKSAERGAKEKALRDALERAGVYVGSYSEVEDAELVTDKIISQTGAVLKVLDTKVVWDGFIVRVTVQVEIDADELNRRLKNIDTPEKNSSPPAVDNIALSKQKFDEGFKFFLDGKFREAISFFNEALKLNPNNESAYNVRGWSRRNLKELYNAISDFKKAIELEPDNANHYDGLGCVYNDLGEHRKAVSVLSNALQLDPNNQYVLEKLGAAYMCLKQYKQAISYCDKSIQINPNDSNYPWAYVTRGKCYEALGEHDKARADFAKARQLGWKG